jgi:hypothetical protein
LEPIGAKNDQLCLRIALAGDDAGSDKDEKQDQPGIQLGGTVAIVGWGGRVCWGVALVAADVGAVAAVVSAYSEGVRCSGFGASVVRADVAAALAVVARDSGHDRLSVIILLLSVQDDCTDPRQIPASRNQNDQ